MLKLYFGNVFAIISTCLILVFTLFFILAVMKHGSIYRWGLMTLALFLLGIAMSAMSGMKDGVGTTSSVIPMNHWVMIALFALGGLGSLSALTALIIRSQPYLKFSFFCLSGVIIAKVFLTEAYRMIQIIGK